jgi:hypothetical protein
VCIAATPEELACELGAVASNVSVLLPWGSLLRGVAAPEADTLLAIRRLCLEGARVELVFSYDAGDRRDARMPPLTEGHIRDALPRAYLHAGLSMTSVTEMAAAELRALGTTWAQRLAFGRGRRVWRLVARAVPAPP